MTHKKTFGPGRLKLSLHEKIKIVFPYFSERFLAQIKNVWLIIVYLFVFQILVLELPIAFFLQISLGVITVLLGLMFFIEGLLLGVMPFSETIGAVLPRKAPLSGVLIFAFIVGIGATFAEPAITVLKTAGNSIKPNEAPLLHALFHEYYLWLIISIGVGVGIALCFGMLRFVYGWSLKILIFPLVTLLLVLTAVSMYVPSLATVISLAWDCGAITTGPVTVPVVLALGIGVCRLFGSSDLGNAGFGVVTLASLFPILAVLILSFILVISDSEGKYSPSKKVSFETLFNQVKSKQSQLDSLQKEAQSVRWNSIKRELESHLEAIVPILSEVGAVCQRNYDLKKSSINHLIQLIETNQMGSVWLELNQWINTIIPILRENEENYAAIIHRIKTGNEMLPIYKANRYGTLEKQSVIPGGLVDIPGGLVDIPGDREKIRMLIQEAKDMIPEENKDFNTLDAALKLAISEEGIKELTTDAWTYDVARIIEKYKTDIRKVLTSWVDSSQPDSLRNSLSSKILTILRKASHDLEKDAQIDQDILNKAMDCSTDKKVEELIPLIPPLTSMAEEATHPSLYQCAMRIDTPYEILPADAFTLILPDKEQLRQMIKEALQQTGNLTIREELKRLNVLIQEVEANSKDLLQDPNSPTQSSYSVIKQSSELIDWSNDIAQVKDQERVDFTKEELDLLEKGILPSNTVISRYSGTLVPGGKGEVLIRETTLTIEKKAGIDIQHLKHWDDDPMDESMTIYQMIIDAAQSSIQAIIPLMIFLLLVFLFLREHAVHPDEIILGVIWAILGLWMFNVGIKMGLTPLGDQVGANLPATFSAILPAPIHGGIDGIHGPLFGSITGKMVMIFFAFVLGYAATLAEPALNVLGKTIETITIGTFKKTLLIQSVAIGVGVGLSLGVAALAFHIPLPYLLIPPYLLLLVLTAFSSETFVNIGWDSAGVTTGPITVPLVLAMGLGISGKVPGLTDGFGVLAMASVMPILSVLTVGFLIRQSMKSMEEEQETI